MSRSFVLASLGVLTALLCLLRFAGEIHWSWLWVTFPAWGFIALIWIATIVDAIWVAVSPKERRKRDLQSFFR